MANGNRYNPSAHSVASRRYALGTCIQIDNTINHQRTYAVITDRGPFIHGRVLDMTPAVARDLGIHGLGVVSYQPTRKDYCRSTAN